MRSDWLPDRRPEPARYSPAHNSLIKSHVVGPAHYLMRRNFELCNLSSRFRAVLLNFRCVKHFLLGVFGGLKIVLPVSLLSRCFRVRFNPNSLFNSSNVLIVSDHDRYRPLA